MGIKRYNDLRVEVPQERRKEINDKILSVVGTGNMQGLSKEDIFNCYTGIGGLHGLSRSNYNSYYSYSEDKKEKEQGQFFTPHAICEEITNLLSPKPRDLIADITCGMGNFFNYFQEANCYGWDIDANAVKVAEFLYPKANIKCDDFRFFNSEARMDYVVGNPPFNLRIDKLSGGTTTSQAYFFEKSGEVLKPEGIVIAITPMSFLKDTMFAKRELEEIENIFDFIGQYELDVDAFKQMGVKAFPTKVVCWKKRSKDTEPIRYDEKEFITKEDLKDRIDKQIKIKEERRLVSRREMLFEGDQEFEYKVNKYLYEISIHKKLQKHENRSLEYVNKYRTQECPDNMDFEEWYKKHRITKNKVLSYLRRIIKAQNVKTKNVVKVVKTNRSVKCKAYSRKARKHLPTKRMVDIDDLVLGIDSMRNIPRPIKKLIEKKKRAYTLQNTPFSEMEKGAEEGNYLRRFYFKDKDDKKCTLNKIQRNDLNYILQKRYSILAWQMGGGKTAAGYCWSKYKPQRGTFVISTSLAITLTWIPFLKTNKQRYVVIKKAKDFDTIQEGDFILLSFHYIGKYKRWIKRLMKLNSRKMNVLFDEGDEITNNKSKKTKNILALFKRSSRTLITTGTTTRNNIGEIYSQLELLYNNSVNFISWSRTYFIEKKGRGGEEDEIKEVENRYFKRPFPAYFGQTAFRRCFNPTKTTVFGIGKQNQDIYNEKDLREIIGKTVITRKLEEIAGDKYDIENIRVKQDESEKEVYRTIIEELDRILPDYFKSTGNSRADSLLKIMRQLSLLIEATSTPQLFDFYTGDGTPKKAHKILDLVKKTEDKIAVGCTTIKCTEWYYDRMKQEFPDREIFKIVGSKVSVKARKKILDNFEATEDGILVATQQSLKSSANIPTCDNVVIESLQWNIPKIEQFFFRFIRYNSENKTKVYFVNYEDTIEVNLLALLMAKERLNDYVKTLDYRENSDIYEEYGIDLDILNTLITKQHDEEGKVQIKWGQAKVA